MQQSGYYYLWQEAKKVLNFIKENLKYILPISLFLYAWLTNSLKWVIEALQSLLNLAAKHHG